jgi:hypothetical protein
MLTSFEMTGYEAGHGGGRVDLELPHGEGAVHATLDKMSLSPITPAPAKPAPHDWRDGEPTSDSELPTKR